MKLALFGVGNAGGRLVDELRGAEQQYQTPITDGNVLAFNTTPSTFAELEHIDESRQVLIGDTHPEVSQPEAVDESDTGETAASAADRREGVDGDPELGAAVAREDLPEIRRALDVVDDTEVDAAMIVAGLGGGTGCGVGSVLLEELASIYEIPIYVLGVLPSADDSDQRAWCAARGVRTFVPIADAVLPVDNEAWQTDETYDAVNRAVATRIVSLFGAGEREGLPLSELRMDPNDIGRTLDVGGLSTIGYVRTDLDIEPDGWVEKLRQLLGFGTGEPEPQHDATTIKKLVERAVDSKLTLPCDISTADRVLLILSGPPRELSRKGFETGRSLLEDKTGTVDVLAGDEPDTDATGVTATVLLSNVTGVPRIEQLQRRAVAFQTGESESVDKPAETVDAQSTETDNEEPTADSDDEVETETGDEGDKGVDDTPAEADEPDSKPDTEADIVDDIETDDVIDTEADHAADREVDTEADDEADTGTEDEADTEVDTKSDDETEETPGESDATAEDHGFRFDDNEPADPEEVIREAEPGADDSVDDSEESPDETAVEASEDEADDESERTADSEDADDSDDEPNIKDPFAGGSTTD